MRKPAQRGSCPLPHSPQGLQAGPGLEQGTVGLGWRAADGSHPSTASRAPTCTVPVLRVILGQVLAESSGCSEGWTAGLSVPIGPPRPLPKQDPGVPIPTQALGTSEGGVGVSQGRQSHPTQRAQGWQGAVPGTLVSQ